MYLCYTKCIQKLPRESDKFVKSTKFTNAYKSKDARENKLYNNQINVLKMFKNIYLTQSINEKK